MSISVEIRSKEIEKESVLLQSKIKDVHERLHQKTGLGNDFLGWLDWPGKITEEELTKIEGIAHEVIENADYLLVIGIGGSYLGARAALEFLEAEHTGTEVLFLGKDLSTYEIQKVLKRIKGKSVYVNVISKSGTTLEPALAFRFVMEYMEATYTKEEIQKRILVTTDPEKGALRQKALQEGYRIFTLSSDIGGRYSVLTPVGLLPIACGGHDIRGIVRGAKNMEVSLREEEILKNHCYLYAASRYVLYQRGKQVELYVHYEPRLHFFAEWLKQLFGESEGKDKKGLFPASCAFTTDLHSLGQFIQDGSPILFETILHVAEEKELLISTQEGDIDGLNYLSGKSLSFVNEQAMLGTRKAHEEGGIINLMIHIPKIDAYHLGELFYFFQKACGIGAYLLEVNPFDQPGVESYKKNMFALLKK